MSLVKSSWLLQILCCFGNKLRSQIHCLLGGTQLRSQNARAFFLVRCLTDRPSGSSWAGKHVTLPALRYQGGGRHVALPYQSTALGVIRLDRIMLDLDLDVDAFSLVRSARLASALFLARHMLSWSSVTCNKLCEVFSPAAGCSFLGKPAIPTNS